MEEKEKKEKLLNGLEDVKTALDNEVKIPFQKRQEFRELDKLVNELLPVLKAREGEE